jgi:ABC-type sugar transport system ATPase subunit
MLALSWGQGAFSYKGVWVANDGQSRLRGGSCYAYQRRDKGTDDVLGRPAHLARVTASPPQRPIGRTYAGRSITKRFGGVPVLEDVSISFEPSEVHTLLGENGAGKSTLLKVMSGIYPLGTGELTLGGLRLGALTPRSAQQRGIYLVPQEPALMGPLSVTENLFLGALRRGRLPGTVDWRSMKRDAAGYLERVGLSIDPEQKAEQLSIAQQQLVECARALVHNCVVIFFDEPTSPLTAHEAGTLFEVVRALREDGYTLGFITHRLDEALRMSDRISVLRDGHVVLSAARSQVDRDALVTAMVGRELATAKSPGRRTAGQRRDEVLTVRDLSGPPDFDGVNMTVHTGEILGLAGLVGSGRTEIAETVFGLRRAAHGTVTLRGNRLEARNPRKCVDAGLVYLPEDRARHGIFAEVDVQRNVTAGILPRLPRSGPLLRARAERQTAAAATTKTAVRMRSLGSLMSTLSGGNQQRAVLSRWLLAGPAVAILDEPTRGVDIGAKEDIYRLIADLAGSGLAFVLISSDLGELTRTCDRVIAIYEGKISGELAGSALTGTALGALIVGAGAG